MTTKKEVAVVQRQNTLPMTRPEVQEDYATPSTDAYETSDAFLLMIDLPGATKESINVSIERASLVVKAGVEPYHKEDSKLLLNELRGKSYYRIFNIGEGIVRDTVDAQFEQGVLTIKLFKSEELKPRQIRIN
jgi:HSP20 family molecular chaperone IbpA